jgi:hypothetical protein
MWRRLSGGVPSSPEDDIAFCEPEMKILQISMAADRPSRIFTIVLARLIELMGAYRRATNGIIDAFVSVSPNDFSGAGSRTVGSFASILRRL